MTSTDFTSNKCTHILAPRAVWNLLEKGQLLQDKAKYENKEV